MMPEEYLYDSDIMRFASNLVSDRHKSRLERDHLLAKQQEADASIASLNKQIGLLEHLVQDYEDFLNYHCSWEGEHSQAARKQIRERCKEVLVKGE